VWQSLPTSVPGGTLLLVGSAIMLRHYSSKVERAKFWILVLLPSLYYVTILLDTLGIYTPQSETDLFNYYVFSSVNGIVGGALLGVLIWSISRTMRPNKSVSNYLLICFYGFVLLGDMMTKYYQQFDHLSTEL
jgi:hypothetical protein